jgi:hypothetical protein
MRPAARAQQRAAVRRISVLMAYDENDPEGKAYFSGFMQGLAELGWTDGRNMRMDVRWAAGNIDRVRMYAKELVVLQPDVILADTTPVIAALKQETRTVPIVFLEVSDPIGSGLPRRRFLHLVSGAVVLPGVSRIARAQAHPSRPVRIIVGQTAGGGQDVFARLIGQWFDPLRASP